ncbi:MAG: SURF1 family protein [Sedimenticola sp.]|nr:SURF1 family protein [Sedimenticola sp.]
MINLSTFQFQPTLINSLLILGIMLPLFLSLGFWQIDRAQQKRTLANTMESRRKLPPAVLDRPLSAGEAAFRSFIAQGEFIADGQVLIANRKHLGKNGFHVITPLRIDNSNRILLVNRGWVAAERNRPPVVETPTGRVTLTGEATTPSPPAIELEFDTHQSNIWPYLTLPNYRAWSGRETLPFILLLSPDSAHGFVRAWEQARPGPGMHLGYAVQWFAFAFVSLMFWLRLSLRRRDSNAEVGS